MYLLSCKPKSNKLNHFVRKDLKWMTKWNPKLKWKFIIIMKVMIFELDSSSWEIQVISEVIFMTIEDLNFSFHI